MNQLRQSDIVIHDRTRQPSDPAICWHAAGMWINSKAVNHECDLPAHPEDLHACCCGYTWSIYDIDHSAA